MISFIRHARGWGLALALTALLAPVAVAAADAEIRRADGTPASVSDVAVAFASADVVYLGEEHDDPVAHRLQAEWLAQACDRAGKRPVALAMEMFERDVQPVLDEYLADTIREKDLLTDARPWPNYPSDYRPLVELAKARGVPVIAANAPRRYVSRVGRLGPSGVDGLSAQARRFLAPGPVPSASVAYAAKFREAMGDGDGHTAGPGLLAAQVLRDAAMADAIARHLAAHPGALVVMVNGKFHSAGHLGIPEQLQRLRPATRQLVVTMARRGGPEDTAPDGDFIVLTPPRTAAGPTP
ncbi:hypothetical protein D3C72_903650 [compost metagenome]